jgi:predicted DCC family thiol-disulfide oxidoreductase YuxK
VAEKEKAGDRLFWWLMISLSSEMTDAKGRHALRGWVFFDRDCSICNSLARRLRRPLESRGYGLAALQDPRVQSLLALPPEDLLREMRVATTEGKIYGGAEAVIYLARQFWWAWPLYAAARLPGVPRILDAGYRWFADHRPCSSNSCSLSRHGSQDSETEKEIMGRRGGALHQRSFTGHE